MNEEKLAFEGSTILSQIRMQSHGVDSVDSLWYPSRTQASFR